MNEKFEAEKDNYFIDANDESLSSEQRCAAALNQAVLLGTVYPSYVEDLDIIEKGIELNKDAFLRHEQIYIKCIHHEKSGYRLVWSERYAGWCLEKAYSRVYDREKRAEKIRRINAEREALWEGDKIAIEYPNGVFTTSARSIEESSDNCWKFIVVNESTTNPYIFKKISMNPKNILQVYAID